MGRESDALQIRREIGGIGAIWYREWKVFLREKSRIVASVMNPILWLLVFGGGLGRNVSIPGAEYQAFIYPGILAQAVLFSSIFFGVYIVWDRKIDFLKEVLVAPISRTSVFIGKVVGGATDSVVQSLILLLLGAVLGRVGIIPGLRPTVLGFGAALLILMLTTVSLVSVGLILGAQMESPEGFQLVSSFLLFPTFFLSGALFPLERLPSWLAPLVLLDPLTYSVDALRHVILGTAHFALALDLAVMAGFAVLVIAVGSVAFQRMRV
ncbi:MAG TPA: ABC transporter permease [Gemmatimonadaceae bacterium]|jgi:ABC-2 type transport system permease protein